MDNQPSTDKARAHLANERTFLSWFRTGLTCMALGIASAQLLERDKVANVPLSTLVAVILTLLGLLLIVLGRMRYRTVAIGINEGTFHAHRRGLDIAVIGAFIIAVLALVFIVHLVAK